MKTKIKIKENLKKKNILKKCFILSRQFDPEEAETQADSAVQLNGVCNIL